MFELAKDEKCKLVFTGKCQKYGSIWQKKVVFSLGVTLKKPSPMASELFKFEAACWKMLVTE